MISTEQWCVWGGEHIDVNGAMVCVCGGGDMMSMEQLCVCEGGDTMSTEQWCVCLCVGT